jgi:hypothetical protein
MSESETVVVKRKERDARSTNSPDGGLPGLGADADNVASFRMCVPTWQCPPVCACDGGLGTGFASDVWWVSGSGRKGSWTTKSVVLCQQTTGPQEGVNVRTHAQSLSDFITTPCVRACMCEGETSVLTCAGGRSGVRGPGLFYHQ